MINTRNENINTEIGDNIKFNIIYTENANEYDTNRFEIIENQNVDLTNNNIENQNIDLTNNDIENLNIDLTNNDIENVVNELMNDKKENEDDTNELYRIGEDSDIESITSNDLNTQDKDEIENKNDIDYFKKFINTST